MFMYTLLYIEVICVQLQGHGREMLTVPVIYELIGKFG